MTELDSRIAISISISDTTVTRPGFGIAAIVHEHGGGSRIDTYSSLTALLVDHPATTPVGMMATAFFSQTYKAESVKVIEREDGETMTQALDAAMLVDSDFYGVLTPSRLSADLQAGAAWCLANSRLFIYASQDDDCLTSASTDPFSIIQALSNNRAIGYYSATAGAEIDITGIVVSGTTATFATTDTVEAGDVVHVWDSAVSALNAAHTVLTVSAGTNFTATVASGTTTDASASKGYVNGNFVDAAIAGKAMPLDAGSRSWDVRIVAGVTADTLTDTQMGYLGGKNGNWVTNLAGNVSTAGLKSGGGGGKTASGRYADLQRGSDWLQVNTQLDLAQLMLNSDGNLGYDAIGLMKVESTIASRMDQGINNEFLTTFTTGEYAGLKYKVVMPTLADIPSADKIARLLDDVEIYGCVRGKIHNLVAAITLST